MHAAAAQWFGPIPYSYTRPSSSTSNVGKKSHRLAQPCATMRNHAQPAHAFDRLNVCAPPMRARLQMLVDGDFVPSLGAAAEVRGGPDAVGPRRSKQCRPAAGRFGR
eukprot:360667-Chlamydomonas_euryale.AAC.5